MTEWVTYYHQHSDGHVTTHQIELPIGHRNDMEYIQSKIQEKYMGNVVAKDLTTLDDNSKNEILQAAKTTKYNEHKLRATHTMSKKKLKQRLRRNAY